MSDLYGTPQGGGLMSLFANPQTAGLLGMAGGLLQASGPSRIPVSMGQAMGMGLQGMQQGAANAMNTQRQLMQMQAMQGLSGLLGANSGPSSTGVAPAVVQQPAVYGAANVGPVSGVSAGMGGYAATPSSAAFSAAAAYPTQAGGPVLFGGKTPAQIRQIGMAASMAGFPAGAELLKMGAQYDPALAMQMPTDAQKMAAAAYGYGTPQYEAALQSQVNKAGYIPPTALRTPIYYDPMTGTTKVVPADQLAAGYGAQYGAEARAQAQYKPVQVWDPTANGGQGGYVYQSQANIADANGSGAAPGVAPGTPNAPAPLRNNNPGALMPGGQLAQYPDMQTGLAALDNNLQAYGKQGVNTLAGVISKWAPPNENNTQAYIQDVSQRLGVKPDQPIDLSNPAVRQALSTGIMLHENGPGAVFSAPSAAARPMAAQPPLGVANAASTSQGAPSKQMSDAQDALAAQDANYQQSRGALLKMLSIAQNGGIGDTVARMLPEDVATRMSNDAAEYQKAHANFVSLQGKALGSGGTDASRAMLDEAVPTFDKPQDAKISGLTDQLDQLDLAHLKRQTLSPVYQQGAEKAYTDLSAQFDKTVTPQMMPKLLPIISAPPSPARTQALQQAIQDPKMKAALDLMVRTGQLK